jgi:hypothetical protein
MAEHDPVGPGNPPRERQYKPGQSGNPRGRPKGSLNARTRLEKILLEQVQGTIHGKTVKRAVVDVIFQKACTMAVAGDLAAMRMVAELIKIFGLHLPQRGVVGVNVDPGEFGEIMAALERDVLERHARVEENKGDKKEGDEDA